MDATSSEELPRHHHVIIRPDPGPRPKSPISVKTKVKNGRITFHTKKIKSKLGIQMGDLGNTFIAGLVIWGTPRPWRVPSPKPPNPQNKLRRRRVNGAWARLGFAVARLGFAVARLGFTVARLSLGKLK